MTGPEPISLWLSRARAGDVHARDQLFTAVHEHLRRMATDIFRRERADHTLEPNALVNELYLRLFRDEARSFSDRAHFFAVAAQTMRRILIDHARAGAAGKRGGSKQQVSLSCVDGWAPGAGPEEIIALDVALSKLAGLDPRAARVVELRFFGGLQEDEVAEVLNVSTITVKRDWKAARAWLSSYLRPE